MLFINFRLSIFASDGWLSPARKSPLLRPVSRPFQFRSRKSRQTRNHCTNRSVIYRHNKQRDNGMIKKRRRSQPQQVHMSYDARISVLLGNDDGRRNL